MIRVKAAFFSLTPPASSDSDDDYLRWHLLDHMPEQYQLPGIHWAQRYIADGALLDSRVDADGSFGPVGNVVNYLVGDPVQQTHDDFMELGRRLADNGRFPHRRPSLQVRMPALIRWYASPRVLIGAEVVPFRPHRGVVVILEEPSGDDIAAGWLHWLHTDHYPAVLATPGVAGVWMYRSTDTWTLHPMTQGSPQHTTVIYLDADPVSTTKALAPRLQERWASTGVRPLFAGPLRTMVQWDVWP